MGSLFNLYNNKTGKYTLPPDRRMDYVKLAVDRAIYKIRELKHVKLKIDHFSYTHDNGCIGIAKIRFHDVDFEQEGAYPRFTPGLTYYNDFEGQIELYMNDLVFSSEIYPADVQSGLANFGEDDRVMIRIAKHLWDAWKSWYKRHLDAGLAELAKMKQAQLYNKIDAAITKSMADLLAEVKPFQPDSDVQVSIDQEKVDDIWNKYKREYMGDWRVCELGREIIVNLGDEKHE